MTPAISRRRFIRAAGAGAVAATGPSILSARDPETPALLDHILLGCSTLDEGIAFIERNTGVRAREGGIHPGRGTQNALLCLGDRRYLEIIAPDPAQADSKNDLAVKLRNLSQPRIVGWAADQADLAAYAKDLTQPGIAFEGPRPGSRKRPDGRLLKWQTLYLKDDASGLLPFFIEWSADSPHPSTDSPKGCVLETFVALASEPVKLKGLLDALNLDLRVIPVEATKLIASLQSSQGDVQLSS